MITPAKQLLFTFVVLAAGVQARDPEAESITKLDAFDVGGWSGEAKGWTGASPGGWCEVSSPQGQGPTLKLLLSSAGLVTLTIDGIGLAGGTGSLVPAPGTFMGVELQPQPTLGPIQTSSRLTIWSAGGKDAYSFDYSGSLEASGARRALRIDTTPHDGFFQRLTTGVSLFVTMAAQKDITARVSLSSNLAWSTLSGKSDASAAWDDVRSCVEKHWGARF